MPAYKDDERGTYYCKFYYTDWQGNKKQKKKRGFKRKKDAEAFERQFLEKMAGTPDMTFKSLADLYMEDRKARIKASTYYNKECILNNHIMPYFGEISINKITPAVVRNWQNDMISKNYQLSYLKAINNLLGFILNYGCKYYGLLNNSASIAGNLGASKSREMNFWTVEQFNSFIENVKHPTAKMAYELLFWSGMRVGELLALQISDFNYNEKTISITKTFNVLKGEHMITSPKTKKSNRVISIPQKVCDDLLSYINSQYDIEDTRRLFLCSKTVLDYHIKKTCKNIGLKKIRIHDLRHSHASMLINLDTPILLVSERLGHEDINTTLRIYSHLYPQKRDEVQEKMNNLINQYQTSTTD